VGGGLGRILGAGPHSKIRRDWTRPRQLVPRDATVDSHELPNAPTFDLVRDLRHRHDTGS